MNTLILKTFQHTIKYSGHASHTLQLQPYKCRTNNGFVTFPSTFVTYRQLLNISEERRLRLVTRLQADVREIVIQLPAGARIASLLQSVQTGTGNRQASHSVGRGVVSFPEVKWPGCEDDHSPLPGVEVQNGWRLPPLPICLHTVQKNRCVPFVSNVGVGGGMSVPHARANKPQ